MKRSHLFSYFLILLGASCWGSIGLFNRLLGADGVSMLNRVAVRNIGALLLLSVVSAFQAAGIPHSSPAYPHFYGQRHNQCAWPCMVLFQLSDGMFTGCIRYSSVSCSLICYDCRCRSLEITLHMPQDYRTVAYFDRLLLCQRANRQ